MRSFSRILLSAAVMLVVTCPASGDEREPTDQPRIIAYGRFEGGGFAFCTGGACVQSLASAEKRVYQQELTLEPETFIDHALFCTLMEDQQPDDCDQSDPPSTPGTDLGWEPNGCGTGGFGNLLLDSGMSRFFSESYSGNFNAPYPGVSFRSACNAHDACWGVAGDRAICDNAFHDSMRSACDAVSEVSSRTVCNGFASAYFSAVSISDIGNENYRQSVANRECALWALDMERNGCG